MSDADIRARQRAASLSGDIFDAWRARQERWRHSPRFEEGDILIVREATDGYNTSPWIDGAWIGRIVSLSGEGAYVIAMAPDSVRWRVRPMQPERSPLYLTRRDLAGSSLLPPWESADA